MNVKQKSNYGFYFVITFMIGCISISALFAQQNDNQWTIEWIIEQKITSIITGQTTNKWTTTKITTTTTWWTQDWTKQNTSSNNWSEMQRSETIKTQVWTSIGTVWNVFIRWFPEDSIANLVSTRAYNKRWIDLVLTLIWENWWFQIDKQSDYINWNWVRERSYGFCQLLERYHAPFIWNTWYSDFIPWYWYKVNAQIAEAGWHTDGFMNWEKHTDYCIEVWDDAKRKWRLPTTFYAYNVRRSYLDRVTIK